MAKPGPKPGSPNAKNGGRPKGAPNKTTTIIRDIILGDGSGDILLQAFECWKRGFRNIKDPFTNVVTSVPLSEKAAFRCLEIVIDRVYPRLQSITYNPGEGADTMIPLKVEISVVDSRKS